MNDVVRGGWPFPEPENGGRLGIRLREPAEQGRARAVHWLRPARHNPFGVFQESSSRSNALRFSGNRGVQEAGLLV